MPAVEVASAPVSTKPVPRRCSARQLRPRTNKRRSIPAVHMEHRRFTRIGWLSIIVRRTECSAQTECYSITKARDEDQHSSPEKLHVPPRIFLQGNNRNCTWEI